jgi:ribonuclease Z|tara:strand:+ start:591 stop:1430 length:840 start_codon:yes stop_codon:yes gene_type:complete
MVKPTRTRIIILGSGSPIANPERSGPALAIIVDENTYIVDSGPGIVRRAAEAAKKYQLQAIQPNNLRIAFLTHLHHDHTAGLPDLMLTPWTNDRVEPLTLIGPPGTKKLADGITQAFGEDLRIRLNGLEPANETGWKTLAKDVTPGVVFSDELVSVEAFLVDHGNWEHAYGYKFTTPDRTIVISGDTTLSSEVERKAINCDVLIHEAYSNIGWLEYSPAWRKYHAAFHTSAGDLGRLAKRAKPKLLVIHHILRTTEGLLDEVRQEFSGDVTIANDLDIF